MKKSKLVNSIKCKRCGQILISKSRHDYVECKCGAVAVDGGGEYLRRVGNPDDYEELSSNNGTKIIFPNLKPVPAVVDKMSGNLVPLDSINHPAHYCSGNIEVIKIMEAKLTPEEYKGYLKANCMKYLFRFEYKDGVKDLKKLLWYCNELIRKLEEK